MERTSSDRLNYRRRGKVIRDLRISLERKIDWGSLYYFIQSHQITDPRFNAANFGEQPLWMVDDLIKFLVARDRDLANLMNYTTAQIAVAFSGGGGDITMADFLPFPPESKIDQSTIDLIKTLIHDGFIPRKTFGILVTAKAIVMS